MQLYEKIILQNCNVIFDCTQRPVAKFQQKQSEGVLSDYIKTMEEDPGPLIPTPPPSLFTINLNTEIKHNIRQYDYSHYNKA